jgi:hypothetical protein
MGIEKINLDIEMDFMNFHFHFKSFYIYNFFNLFFFIFKCYGTSMCGGKKL